uniref:Beta-1,4-mannosyl-glycoprotein 4-beta-N-acetylglucosaminyltransferase n=1 Tax=Glossina morsitans morsitans TaxID=37546 RepID=A0A1B0FNZ3_GLOMM
MSRSEERDFYYSEKHAMAFSVPWSGKKEKCIKLRINLIANNKSAPMHLRLSLTRYDALANEEEKQLNVMQRTQVTPLLAGRGTWTKRVLLWSVLLIQFGFILCFWLLQFGLSDNLNRIDGSFAREQEEQQRVNFIKAESLRSADNSANSTQFVWPSREVGFHKEFILRKSNGNISESERLIFGELTLWCFREGTQNETFKLKSDSGSEDLLDAGEDHCKCSSEWHGRDCGQPEVIWRALMAAKTIFKLKDPSRDECHRLVYMIEGQFFSIDLLEMQVKGVERIIDYFIIFFKRNPVSISDLKSLRRHLKQILPQNNFMLFHCQLMQHRNCSSAAAYHLFRQQQLSSNVIRGDLNHFGGWFCKYCQQPDEVIMELQAQSQTSLSITPTPQNSIEFPHNQRNSHIDIAYLQQLIATGVYLRDGKTQLLRVYRFRDKYFAPLYVSDQSWKYGHLLINIYESLDDLLADDNEDESF